MNKLVFDIETIPDSINGKKIFNLDNHYQTPKDIINKMCELRKEQTGSDFMRHHLHQIVAISAVMESNETIKIWSLGNENSTEKELIERFFEGIEKYSPVLISWNGGGFDLPVLHYRALLYGIAAPRYWEIGEEDTHFKWNNYLNRYHYRHMDLMDILSCYQSKACASLNDIALMLGLPGKLGMDGSQVWEAYQTGKILKIRQYCETDVLNTYLVYLRFELIRGKLTLENYTQKIDKIKSILDKADPVLYPHFKDFLNAWQCDATE